MDACKTKFDKLNTVPAYWYNKACDLHTSAEILWNAIEVNNEGQGGLSYPVACTPVYRMLCGMSLELLFKATLVANGQLIDEENKNTTHNLAVLSKKTNIYFSKEETALLNILTEAIIWSGRYPAPKNFSSYKNLEKQSFKHLYKHSPLGNIKILIPNKKLSWEFFNALWQKAELSYWDVYLNKYQKSYVPPPF